MKKALFATLFAVTLASPAFAAPLTYTIDNKHTFPRFSYSHFGFTTQQSRFNHTSGTVVYDAEAKTASVDITIDMKSVDTGSELFNEHIQEADFLDTATYPTATFKSTKVIFDGDTPSRIEGEMTMKGVTRPVTLTVTSFKSMAHPMLKKPAIGANATTTVKRTEFNAGKYAPAVSDEVTITIAIEAIAK
ncbi:YceI family protein [Nitrogeniibacter mangrovi]|uniref:YceI family protein n=1 Tax=Nitrogeniibacter mangrovi TaxID=2016596 RepID=A0A6C1B542_9RHOO|nr:YceI family protein [Nitrogeniibacter mangrovi]QID17985.1 YceI family protein [Nitrogeniibacter mangrovi]